MNHGRCPCSFAWSFVLFGHTMSNANMKPPMQSSSRNDCIQTSNNDDMIWIRLIAKKPCWTVALILSIFYIFIFILVSTNVIPNKLLFGFCVWGDPQFPSKDMGCSESPQNSHLYSCIIDLFMTCLVIVFWCVEDASSKKMYCTYYMACACIILSHGMLHWFLQQREDNHFDWLPFIVNCYVPKEKMMGTMIHFGYALFGGFSMLLCMIILGFGFGWNMKIMYASLVFTGIILMVTKESGGELVLPGLFCIIHPLTCITGLFSELPAFHERVGCIFIVCTIVGIMELTACDILILFGGHCWYDLTLHLAVLLSLPLFWSKTTRIKPV